MISQAFGAALPAVLPPTAAQPAVTAEYPDGDAWDVIMLTLHVTMASLWLILAVVIALMSVPKLRRVPSASGLHALQVHRATISSLLWGLYLLTLSTGIYLIAQNAIYDWPWNGDDWDGLKAKPYGVPYYYALYAKVGLFLLMGLCTLVLSREATKASKESEASGGPVEEELFGPDYEDETTYGYGGTTKLTTYAATLKKAAKLAPKRTVHVVPLWIAVGLMVLSIFGVGFCVTLIKYFHELSKAAVTYEILKLG